MPIFECPRCNRQDWAPLGQCEWILPNVPFAGFDANHTPVYSLLCPDCAPFMTEPTIPEHTAPRENWVNAPNLITISRLVLSVVLFALISLWQGDGCGIAAGVLFAIAVITDAVDGYLARKYQLITQVGRILDPFADKVIVLGTFIFLLERAPASGVNAAMVVIVLSRELLVTGLRSFLEQHGKDFSANWLGKIKMVLQSVALTVSLLSLSSTFREPAFLTIRDCLLWSAVGVTAYSGWAYIQRAIQALR